MKLDLKNYQEEYVRDRTNLQLKLFGSKRAINCILYFVEGALINDVNDDRLDSNNYVNFQEKKVTDRANYLFDEYFAILNETNYDEEVIHQNFREEILEYAANYPVETNIKIYVKEKKTN